MVCDTIRGCGSWEQIKTLAVTLSYLIYDLACCFLDKQFSLDNTFHHLVSIVGITSALVYGKVFFFLIFIPFSLSLVYFKKQRYDQLFIPWTILQSGSELVAALWVSELSTPFLHIRELIKELGYKDTDLNLVADVSHNLKTYKLFSY